MSRRQTRACHLVVVNTVRRELTLLLLKVVMLGINSLKMFAALLLMTGTTVAFNIYNVPVHHFTSDDPLFGQTLVQSSDGVYVLSPTNGDVVICRLGNNCSKVNIPVSGKKGLRPVASAVSNWNKEKILVCNQVRTKVGSTENLNGNCTLLSGEKKEDINPASLDEININKMTFEGTCHEPLKQDSTNINNNNNNYHGNPTGYQVHQRMRREVEKNDKETDEDEDAGTEIAFVLDGSGSIEWEDFEKAKYFIYNVMKNVWTSCFSCNFAIVQYGSKIRTELSLLENDNGTEALNKVKSIKQTYNLTKTASALYHVLTEVFVPENGSKNDAKKMIILLSDGRILGDNRNLTDVLNMNEMKDILRFAIGVGPDVVNNSIAVKEMIQIAGDESRYFNVSNYAALENILSSLEQSIIGIEGIQRGAGFHLQLAEAGFSTHLTHEGSLLFGAVGAYDWSGGVILKRGNDKTVTFLNSSKEEPRFSYLGYSVTSARLTNKTLYISGAPRYNLTGAVFVFDGACENVLTGDQVGSYFGAVLCALDVDGDEETDHLLVGAPHFHTRGEEGKVVVYKLHQGRFERDGELGGVGYEYARFGSAIASVGDVDGNKHMDVAVGAPLEADDPSGPSGSIYIFNGDKDGIKRQYSQRISPSDLRMKLVHFGQAVSLLGSDGNISVGSEGGVTVLKPLPVIIINPTIRFTPTSKIIPLIQQTNDKSMLSDSTISLQICFDATKNTLNGNEILLIEYQIDLDCDKEEKRLSCDSCQKRTNFTMTSELSCTNNIKLNFVGCYDCFSPIKIKLSFDSPAPSSGKPLRVLDAFRSKEIVDKIMFEKECKEEYQCQSNISLSDSTLSTNTVVIGSTQSLDLTFNLTNTGDTSYITTLTLTYPKILHVQKIGQCEEKNFQITCKLLHPKFKHGKQVLFTVTWQPTNTSDQTSANITAVLTGGNNGTEKLDSKTYFFGVKYPLGVQLKGYATPQGLTVTGEETHKELEFNFQLLGKNEYRAKINVTITIKKETHNTDLKILNVQPTSCTLPPVGTSEAIYTIECSLIDPQKITIKTETHIHDIQNNNNEKIIATAELSFDKNIYEETDMNKAVVEVMLFKITVVTSIVPIIGGSIGGLLFLIILIIILIKCGFFRRRHKVDRSESIH
ncbi:integrin alpha-E [Brachyhypopomus gauderio]|uniref:integrin alpha-E n=1 Tax=Brachyhypopomus gauderio TaxID=698409 RepID=UPI004042F99E